MKIEIERNVLGELRIFKELNMKPNFSALQRKYGIDKLEKNIAFIVLKINFN